MYLSHKKMLAAAAIAALLGGPFGVFAASGGPTVTLSSSAAFTPATPPNSNVTWVDPIPFSVSISSSTSDFDASDLNITGGTVLNFSGSGSSYTFSVDPGDGDPLHATQARYVRVSIDADKFGGNQASNVVEFWFDPAQAPLDSQAPVITFIDPSPANGATLFTVDGTATTTNFTFAFSIDDASSTIMCSIMGLSDADSFYGCGSPQAFSSFPLGSYRFAVKATDTANNMASSSRTFTVAMGTTTPSTGSTSTTTATTTPPTTATTTPPTTTTTTTTSGGGGGGSSATGGTQIVGSSPSAPVMGGSGGFVNPNPIIPTVPAQSVTPSVPNTGTPTVSSGSGASTNTVSTTPTARLVSGSTSSRSGSLATNQSSRAGSSEASVSTDDTASISTPTTTPSAASTPTPGLPNTGPSDQAAAGTADVPASLWIWGAIIVLVLAAVGWLFYRAA
jgi:hypothetical protein